MLSLSEKPNCSEINTSNIRSHDMSVKSHDLHAAHEHLRVGGGGVGSRKNLSLVCTGRAETCAFTVECLSCLVVSNKNLPTYMLLHAWKLLHYMQHKYLVMTVHSGIMKLQGCIEEPIKKFQICEHCVGLGAHDRLEASICLQHSLRLLSCCEIADFQPGKAAPLSSVAKAAGGDIFTADGPKPHTTPQALDKAGIAKASRSCFACVSANIA